jgi:hypothetical protein
MMLVASRIGQPIRVPPGFGRGERRPAAGLTTSRPSAIQLLPRRLTRAEFRVAFASGVSANSVCFERQLLDHYRLVLEKDG